MRKLFISTTILASFLWLAACGRNDTSKGSSDGSPRTAERGGASSTPQDSSPATNGDLKSRDVDNTGVNKRDRNDETLTSGDQGNSREDIDLTRRIRRALTQNDQLSVAAKNVKIITANGKVTLRGPVKSEAEKEQISAAAQQIAGANLDNQLEVKQTTETTQERK